MPTHKYNAIQPAVFTLTETSRWHTLELSAMRFPHAWWGMLNELEAERTARVDKPTTFQYDSLNATIRAMVPQIYAVPEALKTNSANSDPWLLAPASNPPDPAIVHKIVLAWLAATYGEGSIYDDTYRLIADGSLAWEPLRRDLVAPNPLPNGTVQAVRLGYKALTALIADYLIGQGFGLSVYKQPSRFVRTPARNGGVELISWPPAIYTDKKHLAWPFSYVITITMQTVPGDGRPRIHFHYGVRRWARDLSYMGGLSWSVYLLRERSWEGLESAQALAVAELRAKRDGAELWQPGWSGNLPSVAERLGMALPEVKALVANPLAWCDGQEGLAAAVSYPRTPRFHPVRSGMDLGEHSRITQALAEALQGQLELVPVMARLSTGGAKSSNPLEGELRNLSREERLAALARSVDKKVRIEVYWRTEQVRDMLVDRIKAVLTRPLPPQKEIEIDTERAEQLGLDFEFDLAPKKDSRRSKIKIRDEDPVLPALEIEDPIALGSSPEDGTLEIVTIQLSDLDMALPAGKEGVADRRARMEDRAQLVLNQAPRLPEELVVLALFELPDYSKGELRKSFRRRDPKLALRLGFARAGRVIQFVTPIDPTLRSGVEADLDLGIRCDKAVRDGLRQLGYMPTTLYKPGRTKRARVVPPDLAIAAVWILRLTRKRTMNWQTMHLPVVVIASLDHPRLYAWLPFTEAGAGIMDYRKALMAITRLNPDAVRSRSTAQERVLSELREFLTVELPRIFGDNILLLAASQNARATWPGLTDGRLIFDKLLFGLGPDEQPVANERIRLVRLRTSDRNETPEYYLPEAQSPSATSGGVWVDSQNERVFYNTAGRPSTADKRPRRGKETDPTEHNAIPNIVEIVPAVLPVAERTREGYGMWAEAIDEWRGMSILLAKDMTLFPLPLAYAEKMDEYAVTIGPWVFDKEDQWDEPTDELEEDEESRTLVPGQALQLKLDL